MGIVDSLRVCGAMARVTAPTVVEALRGRLSRDAVDHRTHWFGQRVVELLGIDLHVTGAERVPPGRAYVYMSNHQSHLDIPMLYASLPSPTIRMLAKKELFRIPVWGQAIRAAEFIEVDRGEHGRAVESSTPHRRSAALPGEGKPHPAINHAKDLVAQGVSVWLAPEGTRSRTGAIGPLKKGGFHLAIGTGTPIVPVAIRGTLAILPPGGKAMATGQRVDVTIGAPIAVAGRDVPGLVDEVQHFLVENSR